MYLKERKRKKDGEGEREGWRGGKKSNSHVNHFGKMQD